MPRGTLDTRLSNSSFAYGTLTPCGWPSQTIRLDLFQIMQVQTPAILQAVRPVWPLPRSLATTYGISVDFSSSPYLDVSVRAVPHVWLCIHHTLTWYCHAGFPHSEISGSTLICSSPKLIAACHVLHRLLMPRHSPCALSSLTSSLPGRLCSVSGFGLGPLPKTALRHPVAPLRFGTRPTRIG